MYETPTTIWPTDRAWCVAVWTDAVAAYVGGTADLIARLCADDNLETDAVASNAAIDDWTAGWARHAAARSPGAW